MAAGRFDNARDFLNDLFKDDGTPNFELLQLNIDLLKDSDKPDENLYYTGSISENLLYIKFKDKMPKSSIRAFQIWSDDSLIIEFLLDCFGDLRSGTNFYKIWDRDNNLVQTPLIEPFVGNENFSAVEFDAFVFNSFTQIINTIGIKVKQKQDEEAAQQQADFDNYRRDLLNYINS